jgi:Carboxypeptidase regulatory-like domain
MSLKLRLLGLFLAGALLAWGQANANKAQLAGVVLDPNGAVIPNASVQIKNPQTGLLRELHTGSDGSFLAVQLDPGVYEVVAKSPGFSPTTLQNIELSVGAAVSVTATLQVQPTTVSIEVSETMLNSDLPAPSTLLTSKAITDLPINGRRFQDFALLTPTVQVDLSRSQISFVGQRGINSNIMVDGADYNQPFFGGIRGGERSNSIITVPQSSVQEFQAVTTGYAAEYGRSTGGVLNVITKSGTNEYHGEAFYQNRPTDLSKEGPIPVPDLSNPGTLINVKPAESLQQWGGAVGGPILRDRLFFFLSYEQQHAVQPRQVVFSSLIGFTPTPANTPAYDFYKSQEQKFDKTNNAGAGLIKGDYLLKNGSRLTLRYDRSGSEEDNAVTVGGAIEAFTTNALSSEGIEEDRMHFGTAQYTWLISPALVNDLKFSGSYETRPRLANTQEPGITISALGTVGTRNFLPTIEDDSRYQVTDTLSWIKGAHTFKAGLDYNKLHTAQTFGFDQFGTFSISSSNISTILDILSGAGSVQHLFDSTAASYSRQVGNLIVDYGATQAALFAEDSWRATRSLTIDYGLRWEGQWNPSVQANNTDLVNRVDGFTYPNNAQLNVTRIPNALKQFMPRVGFAWSPGKEQRFVIRGHAGIFYAATPLLIYSDPTANFRLPPNNVRLFLRNTTNGTIYQQFLAAGVNLDNASLGSLPIIPLDAVEAAASAGLGTAPDPFAGAGTSAVATDFVNPRSYQFGLGGESRLTSRWTAGLQFNYVNTVHLERNRDYNLPLPVVLDASDRPLYCISNCPASELQPRPIATLGQINVRESSARSLYRGLTFSNQYRGSKLQAGVFYTLAWSYSDDDNERDSGGQSALDAFNYKLDYSYSNLDARHEFASYAVYSLPLGFDVSGSFRVHSGFPLNPRTGADTNGDGAATDRPLTAPGVFFPRNSFRNRAVYGDDFRILKSFRLGETRRIELSAEFFNLFNIDNVIFGNNAGIYGLGINSTGESVPVDARFQRLKSASGKYDTQNSQVGFPFQTQFGARFFF